MTVGRLIRRRIFRFGMPLLALLSLSVCSDDTGVDPGEDVVEITVTPASATFSASGETRQFEAVARDGDGNAITDVSLTWTSSNTAVATVSGTGLVTARDDGEARITAEADGVSGSATVTVSRTAAAVSVTPAEASIDVGGSQSFTATVEDSNGNALPDAAVNWSSSDEAVATVDASGNVTGQAAGTATITAESDGVSGTATVEVRAPIAAVEIDPGEVGLAALGATAALTATVTDDQGNTRDDVTVEWTSSDEAVATVDQSGTVTAVANGSATVTATVDGVAGTATVDVQQEAAAVVVMPATASAQVGSTQQFTARVDDANGNEIVGAEVNWSSSDEAVATVDQTGLATAQAEGTATVSGESGGVTGTATLTVTVPIESVEVTPASSDLTAIGATVQLTATVTDANGAVVEEATVTWSSSDEAVATVDETGLVTAAADGTAEITAAVGDVSGTATVNVAQQVSAVVVTPATAEVGVGETQQFSARAEDANGNEVTGATITWSTSDEAVATVDDSGLATGQASGTATITATADGVAGDATLTVTAAPALSLVSGDGQTDGRTEEDFSAPLVVEITDSNGDPVEGGTVEWAIVQGDGTLSAGSTTTDAQGRATVTVTAGASTGEVVVEASAEGTQGSPVTFTLDVTVLVVAIVDNAFVDNQGRTNANFDATIRQGDTIEWVYTSDGSSIHTVTSTDEPDGGSAFDSGNLTPGESFQFTPDATGTWTFFCEIHPSIMVNATFTVTS